MAYILYHYNPSLAAAILFVILFVCITLAHTYSFLKHRTWYFIPFVLGGYFEAVGYIGRAISAQQSPNWTTGPYIQQSLLLLLAPALFAASIYMILGRIIVLVDGNSHSLIHSKYLTIIFVTGDVLSFFIQSGGGAMLATSKADSNVTMGQNIIIGGLVLQLIFFAVFVVVTGVFHFRIKRQPTLLSQTIEVPWRSYLQVLYAASCLIMVRNIFRMIEYSQGQDGYLLSSEVWLYIFDSVLMFVTMVLFQIFHPSKIVSHKTVAAAIGMQDRTRAHK